MNKTNLVKIISITCTIVGGVLSLAQQFVEKEKMRDAVAKEVQKQLSLLDSND